MNKNDNIEIVDRNNKHIMLSVQEHQSVFIIYLL